MYPPVRGSAAPPIPGYQDFYARQFELARSMIKRHSKLAASRAVTALLLVLADLLVLSAALWLGLNLTPGGGALVWLLRLFLWLILAGAWLCGLFSIGFALSAATWKMNPGSPGSELFFQSGEGTPSAEAAFTQQFKKTSQAQMHDGALRELYQLARFRQRQEKWLRYAILFFVIALLGISVSALFAIII